MSVIKIGVEGVVVLPSFNQQHDREHFDQNIVNYSLNVEANPVLLLQQSCFGYRSSIDPFGLRSLANFLYHWNHRFALKGNLFVPMETNEINVISFK